MFDNAIIDNPKGKQCEDSIYPGYEQSSYSPPPINKAEIGCVNTMCLHAKHAQAFST